MASLKQVTIAGKQVGHIGYGLMDLTMSANPPSTNDVIAIMKRAVELGATSWNGGKFYGSPDRNSLHLLEQYFTKYPEDKDKVQLNLKLGFDLATFTIDGSLANVNKEVDESLAILRAKTLDIVEVSRIDPNISPSKQPSPPLLPSSARVRLVA
jgi:pyridoxine 4-dehydrogenase